MGWAARAREASERLQVRSYRVRRWTAYEWTYPDGNSKAEREVRDAMRKNNEDHLKRAASIIERRLKMLVDGRECRVKQVRVERESQLMFELVVLATDGDDARRRATYRIVRALDAKIPTGRTRMVHSRYVNRGRPGMVSVREQAALAPTFGKVEAEVVKEK